LKKYWDALTNEEIVSLLLVGGAHYAKLGRGGKTKKGNDTRVAWKRATAKGDQAERSNYLRKGKGGDGKRETQLSAKRNWLSQIGCLRSCYRKGRDGLNGKSTITGAKRGEKNANTWGRASKQVFKHQPSLRIFGFTRTKKRIGKLGRKLGL